MTIINVTSDVTDATDIGAVIHNIASLSTYSNKEIAYVAQKTCDYTDALTNKHISKAEFDDLMADLKVDQIVARTADEQDVITTLSSLINNLLSVITLLNL
jgi:hypothetical protein